MATRPAAAACRLSLQRVSLPPATHPPPRPTHRSAADRVCPHATEGPVHGGWGSTEALAYNTTIHMASSWSGPLDGQARPSDLPWKSWARLGGCPRVRQLLAWTRQLPLPSILQLTCERDLFFPPGSLFCTPPRLLFALRVNCSADSSEILSRTRRESRGQSAAQHTFLTSPPGMAHPAQGLSPLSAAAAVAGDVSYPKNKIKGLLLERISPAAAQLFLNEGYQVHSTL